jgi:hypothetical protein
MPRLADGIPVLVVRIHPSGKTASDLSRQFEAKVRSGQQRTCLLRTVAEDPEGVDLQSLGIGLTVDAATLIDAWSDAQLAGDSTLLGLAVGLRVALVPERGRWFADPLIVRTGARLRVGRGWTDPCKALRSIQRSFRASHLDPPALRLRPVSR